LTLASVLAMEAFLQFLLCTVEPAPWKHIENPAQGFILIHNKILVHATKSWKAFSTSLQQKEDNFKVYEPILFMLKLITT
jgi:hypothetical protein